MMMVGAMGGKSRAPWMGFTREAASSTRRFLVKNPEGYSLRLDILDTILIKSVCISLDGILKALGGKRRRSRRDIV